MQFTINTAGCSGNKSNCVYPNVLWYEIYDIVKANCSTAYEGFPQDDMMEQLLRKRRGSG